METIGLKTELDTRSLDLRKDILLTLRAAQRGHLGSAFSLVEIIRVLFDDILHYDADNPEWEDRDRFILSKGHGCLALYALLADKGFIPRSELWSFCQSGGILGGNPDHKVPGVEASTGSLGHGLSIGLGFALSARMAGRDTKTVVILGDGECNEGSIWEAAMSAGKHGLDSLTVLVDYNKHQSYDATSVVQDLEPFPDKWTAFGFNTREVDGHDIHELRATLSSLPYEEGKPNAIICHTVKGKGIPQCENDLAWHHKSKISSEDIDTLMNDLGVSHA